MNSDERLTGRGFQPDDRPHFRPTERTLHTVQMRSGVKIIIVALHANRGGYFIRIVVEDNSWYNAIIVSISVTAEFRQCIESVTKGGPVAKGMIESEGRTIFVRLESDGLLLGERSRTRNLSITIPQAAIGEFKKMLDDVLVLAFTLSEPQGSPQRKPHLDERTFYSRKLPVGTKTLNLMLKENVLGRFVRLVEGDGFRFTSVIIPAAQLEKFRDMLDEVISVSNQTPGPVDEDGSLAPSVKAAALKTSNRSNRLIQARQSNKKVPAEVPASPLSGE